MKKLDLENLIAELERKKERYNDEAQELRDQMYEAYGARDEIELTIWKLEKFK